MAAGGIADDKAPGFALVACLSLAIGIGATTAAFAVLYAVMLRDLPVRDPGSLAVVSTRSTGFQYSMSYPAYVHLRDHSTSIEGLIGHGAIPEKPCAISLRHRSGKAEEAQPIGIEEILDLRNGELVLLHVE